MSGDELRQWLSALNLAHLHPALVAESIDLDIISALSDDDLRELGVSMGDRRRFLRAAADTGKTATAGVPADASPGRDGRRDVERRHITVLFCDLVGSTALSNRLDDESFARIVRRYSEICEEAVVRCGGRVAKFTGDGLMGYFGYPIATGDEAAKAVEAGFLIQREIRSLDAAVDVDVAARVGIASGSAIIGEVLGDQIDALGDTPNLAGRVEAHAEAGSVTVAEVTAQLASDSFEFADAGMFELKGFAGTTRLFRAVRPLTADPFGVDSDAGATVNCIGRAAELAAIDDARRATEATGATVMLIDGEAGVGKSVLTQAAVRSARSDGWPVYVLGCVEHETSTPLHPLRRLVEALAGIDIRHDDADRYVALDALAVRSARPDLGPVLRRVLGLTDIATSESADGRTEIFDTAIALLRERLTAGPLMVVVDDLQWCDPTSIDLLVLIRESLDRSGLFILCTRRSGAGDIDERLQPLSVLKLMPFSSESVSDLMESILGHRVADSVVETIAVRAGGVPLYIAELTRRLAELGAFAVESDSLTIDDSEVPATLQDSLLARLDRLPNGRDVAPVAAAIGLDFSLSLLEAAFGDVTDAVRELERANLVTVTDQLASFRHALIRSVAYQRLVGERRADVHERIGRALIDRFPERAATEPHVVARHLALGRSPIDAVIWFRDAARMHARLSAHPEVIANVEAGLAVLRDLGDVEGGDVAELELQMLRAGTLRATLGFGAAAVGEAYERCRALAEATGDLDAMSTALNGMYTVLLVQDRYAEAGLVATKLLDTADQLGDLRRRVIAHRAVGVVAFHVGDFTRCQPHLDESIRLYHEGAFVEDAWLVGTDHATTAASFRAMNEIVSGLGDPWATITDAIAYAESIDHFLSWAQTVTYRGFLGVVGRDWDEAEAAGGELLARLIDHKIPLMEASGGFWYAAGRFHNGVHREVDELWAALRAWWATGANNYAGYLRSVIAEAELELDRPEVALATIEPAFVTIAGNGERWALAECHRVRAEVRRRLGDEVGSREDREEAHRVAAEQGASLWIARLRDPTTVRGAEGN